MLPFSQRVHVLIEPESSDSTMEGVKEMAAMATVTTENRRIVDAALMIMVVCCDEGMMRRYPF